MTYHVLNRAVGRMRLFRGEQDYLAFCRVFREATEREASVGREAAGVLGWVVMPNHWHLILRPVADRDLTHLLRW